MTPKEKAESMVEEISFKAPLFYEECIDVSLYLVDEILKACPIELVGNSGKFKYTDDYWNEVKQELNKL